MLILAGKELIFFTVTGMGLFWICAGNSSEAREFYTNHDKRYV